MGNNDIHKLPFLLKHKRTFELIREGKKKIESRAGSPKYLEINEGDNIEFSCGNEKTIKQVKKILHYNDLDELFAAYEPETINPEISSDKELRKKYLTFPGYNERIKKYGILVFELK